MNRQTIFRALGVMALATSAMAGTLSNARADLTINYGTGATKYSIMNFGAAAASVSAAYYPEAGTTPDVTDSLNIATANGRLDVNVATVGGLSANWKGSVVLSSDQQVGAVAVTNYTGRSTFADSASAVPGTEMSAYEAALSGNTTNILPAFRIPMAASGTGKQTSRVTVMNTVGSQTAYTITYVAADGSVPGTSTGTLNAYGSKTIDTAKDADLPVNFVTNMTGKGGGFIMKVASDKGVVVLGETTSIVTDPPPGIAANWSGDFLAAGPAQASTKLYSPAAFRLCPPASVALCATPGQNYSTYIQYSAYQLQNTTGVEANVQAKFVNAVTGLISYTQAFTIAPNSGYGINLFNGGSVKGASATALFNALGARFGGSLIVESDQPLIGIGNLDFPQATVAYYGSYSLVSAADASSLIYAPMFNRQCSAGVPATCSTSNLAAFEQVSAFQIINVGASTCNSVNIQILNANGSLAVNLAVDKNGNPVNLASGASLGLNSFNGGGYAVSQFDAQLGYNFAGSIKVSAPGCSLKAIVETRNGTTGFDQYNAFNQ